jgi:hypothetical protein
MKKPTATPEKPVPKVKADQPINKAATKVTPKKTSPIQKPSTEVQAVIPKPVVTKPELTVSERIGLTAGNIWQYLSENGSTSVSKIAKELTEEEKIIQRSIGWLAQEDKITLSIVDRVETIALR